MPLMETDRSLLRRALRQAGFSPDPNTKVGCTLAIGEHVLYGYNHLPRAIPDAPAILADRTRKLQAIVHAEMDVICKAARACVSTVGATLYTAATDDSGAVWGGPPCTNCCKHVIQCGITRVVTYRRKSISWWSDELDQSERWLEQAGVELCYLPYGD